MQPQTLPAHLLHDRTGRAWCWRLLAKDDSARLAGYFAGLLAETRRRFGPHPLTAAQAHVLCAQDEPDVLRFVLLPTDASAIVGYFILDFGPAPHEALRYAAAGIVLATGLDPVFAPSIADDYQNTGLASALLPHIVAAARARGARSLVLMGGTQASNARTIAYYEKHGFTRHGGYWTDEYNHDMRLLLQQPVLPGASR